MKSIDIRKLPVAGLDGKLSNTPEAAATEVNIARNFILREVAAQIAEVNENYQEFKKLFTTEGSIDVNMRVR